MIDGAVGATPTLNPKRHLLDVLRRSVSAADVVGIRAVLVHAKDASAKRFYQHFDFDPSPVDPMHLFLLVKEIKRLLVLEPHNRPP